MCQWPLLCYHRGAMALEIATFDRARHLDAAAMLLADRHRRDRERDARLPGAYEVPAACRPLIEQALDGHAAQGVVCSDGGRIVGYAVMSSQVIAQTHFLASFFPPRQGSISLAAQAAEAGAEYDVYREMYAALADRFVSLGFFDHSVNIAASDTAARDAYVSLGFGLSMSAAIRDVAPTTRVAAATEVHQAGAEDAEQIFALSEELTLHHARSPIFNPYIRESDDESHNLQRGLLADPANAHWVAYDGTRAIGMNTFMPPGFLSPMTVPDKTVYLFQGVVSPDARQGGVGTAILSRSVAWAREQGFAHVALHYATANIQGARFWQSSGFKPVEYGMRRRIDERIAWANK